MKLYFNTILFSVLCNFLNAQQFSGWYWVQFTDKNHSSYSIEHPEQFLSARAIQRRINQHIPIRENDLPVSTFYCDSLTKLGIPIINTSKWLNAVVTGNIDSVQVALLYSLDFVKKIQRVKPSPETKSASALTGLNSCLDATGFDYGIGFDQIHIHHGDKLHTLGYTGKGMVIAIIDAGFKNADIVNAFQKLWNNHQILGYRDFVNPSSNIFNEYSHGTTVLSVIGSNLPGILTGTAPDASFWLLRSEDVSSEYLIEEDNWVSAAEFADSAGADVINTSLGYTRFDDPEENHTYSDMDGNTTHISIGADIAASKGMLVVNSAGNDGTTDWKYIGAPADADSVLSIGAIDFGGNIAYFSSRGPTADGRIKPNVCAVGLGTHVISSAGLLTMTNGTSVSSPIITGLSACLWQANRSATNMEIFNAIQESSDRYTNPDTIYGYGIPDFYKANLMLKAKYRSVRDTVFAFNFFPNPFRNEFYLSTESDDDEIATLTVYNTTGVSVNNFEITLTTGYNLILIENLSHLAPGVYFMRLQSKFGNSTKVILKQ